MFTRRSRELRGEKRKPNASTRGRLNASRREAGEKKGHGCYEEGANHLNKCARQNVPFAGLVIHVPTILGPVKRT